MIKSQLPISWRCQWKIEALHKRLLETDRLLESNQHNIKRLEIRFKNKTSRAFKDELTCYLYHQKKLHDERFELLHLKHEFERMSFTITKCEEIDLMDELLQVITDQFEDVHRDGAENKLDEIKELGKKVSMAPREEDFENMQRETNTLLQEYEGEKTKQLFSKVPEIKHRMIEEFVTVA